MIATSTISQNWERVGYCAHSLRVWNDTSAGPKCFISQFYVVAKVAIIQKMFLPNLAIHQIWKDLKKNILIWFWPTYWNKSSKSGDLEIFSSKSNEELTELKAVLLFMAWQFKKRQQSSMNLGHFLHKFPCMGWNSIFQVIIWLKFASGRIPGETHLLQGIRETKLVHHSLKRQLVLWEEMSTYTTPRNYHNNHQYNIFTTSSSLANLFARSKHH